MHVYLLKCTPLQRDSQHLEVTPHSWGGSQPDKYEQDFKWLIVTEGYYCSGCQKYSTEARNRTET